MNMIPDEQRRAIGGNVAQPANLGAEVVTEDCPPEREHSADVVGVPRVDVVALERPAGMDEIARRHLGPCGRSLDRGACHPKCRSQIANGRSESEPLQILSDDDLPAECTFDVRGRLSPDSCLTARFASRIELRFARS